MKTGSRPSLSCWSSLRNSLERRGRLAPLRRAVGTPLDRNSQVGRGSVLKGASSSMSSQQARTNRTSTELKYFYLKTATNSYNVVLTWQDKGQGNIKHKVISNHYSTLRGIEHTGDIYNNEMNDKPFYTSDFRELRLSKCDLMRIAACQYHSAEPSPCHQSSRTSSSVS